jgi:hypothetical protein
VLAIPALALLARRRGGPGALLALALLVDGVGCGSNKPAAGTLGGDCIAGGIGNPGLMCGEANTCVTAIDGGTTPDGAIMIDAGAADASGPDGPFNQPPIAMINHPGSGTRMESSGPFAFVGVGMDPEDGALSGMSLVWTSNIDGQFGTGSMFNYLPSLGVHTITLTVTDSGGKTGTDSITVTMVP